MTELKVDAIVNLAGSGKPNLPVAPTVGSNAAISTLNTHSYTSSGTEPSSPKNGALWWDSANDKVKVYIDSEFKEVELNYSAASAVYYGDRAHWAGGGRNHPSPGGYTNAIDYWNITSLGNAADFGDISATAFLMDAASDGTYIYNLGSGATSTAIDYWASATLGNASDFGDTASTSAGYVSAAASNGSKCLYHIDHSGSAYSTDIIEQFPTGTAGITATDFDNLTVTRWLLTPVNSDTRCVFMGGQNVSYVIQNVLDYVDFANAGNATDFGDLTSSRYQGAGAGSNSTARGLYLGGYVSPNGVNNIDYITVDTPGNGTDHGDLTSIAYGNRACANTSRVCNAGGTGHTSPASTRTNVIDYTALMTAGNAADFGDLTEQKYIGGSASGAAS